MFRSARFLFALPLCLALLSACSPTFNWREVRGEDGGYAVMLPAKPSTHARAVDFGGTRAMMTMTGAEAGGATFAVGTAQFADAAAATRALLGMKHALAANIGAKIRSEKTAAQGPQLTIDMVAAGGKPARVLHARLVAKGTRVYQAIAVGEEGKLPAEAVETFLASFRLP